MKSNNAIKKLENKVTMFCTVIFFLLFLVLAVMLSMVVISPMLGNSLMEKNLDCYFSHVQECQACQEKNMTYLLCSGFCVPNFGDWDGKGCPIISPTKNCLSLPRECNFP